MKMVFQKYHGAGNDFLLADGRNGIVRLDTGMIRRLCDRHLGFGADGLILLKDSGIADFSMAYYNSDGSTGMMCGNGGRCIAAFAHSLGFGEAMKFEAADCVHEAEILGHEGGRYQVRLSMTGVSGATKLGEEEYYLETGTRHYVRFVPSVEEVDVVAEGSRVRHSERFAPSGVNANYVSDDGTALTVRTYERGVEDETLACGTGVVASALAGYVRRGGAMDGMKHSLPVRARVSELGVEFVPCGDGSFSDVWLTGPAECVGEVATSDGFFASSEKCVD